MRTVHERTCTSVPATMTGRALLEEIAKSILEDVYKKLRTEKASVFLCGKGLTAQSSMRSSFATALKSGPRSHMIKIMFPEDIFEELLAGSKSHDLLSLENLLAAAVDVVVVVLESAGAIAELGAFSNHKAISKKLIIM